MAQTRTTTMIHVKDDVEIKIGATLYDNLAVDIGDNVTVFFTRDAADELMHLLQAALQGESAKVAQR